MGRAMSELSPLNRAQALASQLSALLEATTGEAGEGFRVLSDHVQNDFMWACADIATQLKKALEEVDGARHE